MSEPTEQQAGEEWHAEAMRLADELVVGAMRAIERESTMRFIEDGDRAELTAPYDEARAALEAHLRNRP